MNKEEYLWLSQLNVTNNQNKPQDLTCHSTLSVWQRKNKATEIELKVRNDILKYRAQCSEKYEEIQSSSFSFPWIHQQPTGLSTGLSPIFHMRAVGWGEGVFTHLLWSLPANVSPFQLFAALMVQTILGKRLWTLLWLF